MTDACQRGHEFTAENTLRGADGHRRCRICQQASRARQVRHRVEPRVPVDCPECGDQRLVGARHAFRIRKGEASGTCQLCNYGWTREAPAPARYVRWWIDQGWTPEDAREVWEGLSLLVPSTYDDDAIKEAA